MGIKRFAPAIPGFFTFGNLVCGFFALLHTMGPKPENAAWFIFLGAFLDLLDGKLARLTRGATRIGIQLDSLADFMTFGVAPVALMHSVGLFTLRDWKLAVGILYLFASAFRLARFNVSAKLEGANHFYGLPTPCAAIAVAGGILFIQKVWPPVYGTGALGSVAVLAWLMVSNVRYPKWFPKTDLSKGVKSLLIIPLFIVILALILFPVYTIYPLIVIYIIVGLIRELIYTLSRRTARTLESEDNDEILSG